MMKLWQAAIINEQLAVVNVWTDDDATEEAARDVAYKYARALKEDDKLALDDFGMLGDEGIRVDSIAPYEEEGVTPDEFGFNLTYGKDA